MQADNILEHSVWSQAERAHRKTGGLQQVFDALLIASDIDI